MRIVTALVIVAIAVTSADVVSAQRQPVYFIVENEKTDTPLKAQVLMTVAPQMRPSRADVEALLRHVHGLATAERGFKHHAAPTHVFVFVIPGTARDRHQWIGRLQRIGAGARPEIEIDDERLRSWR